MCPPPWWHARQLRSGDKTRSIQRHPNSKDRKICAPHHDIEWSNSSQSCIPLHRSGEIRRLNLASWAKVAISSRLNAWFSQHLPSCANPNRKAQLLGRRSPVHHSNFHRKRHSLFASLLSLLFKMWTSQSYATGGLATAILKWSSCWPQAKFAGLRNSLHACIHDIFTWSTQSYSKLLWSDHCGLSIYIPYALPIADSMPKVPYGGEKVCNAIRFPDAISALLWVSSKSSLECLNNLEALLLGMLTCL